MHLNENEIVLCWVWNGKHELYGWLVGYWHETVLLW